MTELEQGGLGCIPLVRGGLERGDIRKDGTIDHGSIVALRSRNE
jgi:hypothetical protein